MRVGKTFNKYKTSNIKMNAVQFSKTKNVFCYKLVLK